MRRWNLPLLILMALAASGSVVRAQSASSGEVSATDVDALIARMQAQVEAMAAATAEREEALSFLEEQIERAAGHIEGAEETADALEQRAANLDLQVEGLSAERAELSTTIDERARLVAELEARIAGLSNLLGREQDVKSELQLALEKEQKARKDVEIELAEARASADAQANVAAGRLQEKEVALGVASEQVEQLQGKIERVTRQLEAVSALLDRSDQVVRRQQARITDLGAQLNQALAEKVEELSQYRSEFFGRLKQALGERPEFRIVGDRFVFQSEVLFASGSARIDPQGREQLRQLATTLREVAATIPSELDWILRVDGHTDKVPIGAGASFASNWELSTARAISVVEVLISENIDPRRLAATGFGEFQPLDPRDDEIGYRRNRRIEFKLTSG